MLLSLYSLHDILKAKNMRGVNGGKSTRHIGWTVLAVVLLIILALFALRVIVIYDKISRGDYQDLAIDFSGYVSTGQGLVESSDDEVYDVATEDDPSFGPDNAELTIVQFADFGCPYCADTAYTVRRLQSRYPNQIKFIFRDFPITENHPNAQLAAEAAQCADEQGMFWQYHDKLYQNQSDHSRDALKGYTVELNMDYNDFVACLNSGRYRSEVQEDYSDGVMAGVYGTPTFFFNGRRVQGAIPDDVFGLIVDAFLNGTAE